MGHFYFLFNLLVGAEIGYGDMYLTSTLEYVRNKVKSKIDIVISNSPSGARQNSRIKIRIVMT